MELFALVLVLWPFAGLLVVAFMSVADRPVAFEG